MHIAYHPLNYFCAKNVNSSSVRPPPKIIKNQLELDSKTTRTGSTIYTDELLQLEVSLIMGRDRNVCSLLFELTSESHARNFPRAKSHLEMLAETAAKIIVDTMNLFSLTREKENRTHSIISSFILCVW